MSRRPLAFLALALGLVGADAEARVVRVTIDRREPVLGGRPFGLAGPYETLVGTVEVPNRGGKGILRRPQYAEPSLDPREPPELGDGWLLQQRRRSPSTAASSRGASTRSSTAAATRASPAADSPPRATS